MRSRTRLLPLLAVLAYAIAGYFGLPVPQPAGSDTLHANSVSANDSGSEAPSRLVILPSEVVLRHGRDRQQLVVTGEYAQGAVRDLTRAVRYQIEPTNLARISDTGVVTPLANGTGTIHVEFGSVRASVPLRVEQVEVRPPISFRQEVIAAFNVAGCNMGACHGTPNGKNGFKLSLRGYDPDSDYVQLTRDMNGRRTNLLQPELSLLLLKGSGRVPHEGGQRFAPGLITYEIIRQWIAEGMQPEDAGRLPRLERLEVLPGSRTLLWPGQTQQLAVLAYFSDGSRRDVTPLSVFSSSDETIATVDRQGHVQFKYPGEVAILVRYLETMVTVRLALLRPDPQFAWPNVPENNLVDRLVFAKLKRLQIPPSDLCTDAEFIRRVYLDVCGILPTAEEVRAFLDDRDPAKRSKLIDRVLERPEYADYWTLKWADVLRANRKTMQLDGVFKFQAWLRAQIASNRPWNEVITELLTASGSTYTSPAANYYRVSRDPTILAETTAQLFLGVRMQCAKCHNHPFERWTQDDYYGLAAFFARVKLKNDPLNDLASGRPASGAEFVYLDRSGEVVHPRTNQPVRPKVLDQAPLSDEPADRREILARWLTDKSNPFVAKALVNRIWYHLFGRGIVEPADDFRDSNPASHDELLEALAREFLEHGFDAKHIIRLILNSRTYQLSAQTNERNRDDQRYFSHCYPKLLPAEVLLDAISQATGVPERFAGLPLGTRAVQLPDGEVNHVFLKTFGQPARELSCECERESESNLAQALQLINGPTIHQKLREPNNRLGQLLAQNLLPEQILEELYLSTLSRRPETAEVQAALQHVEKSSDKRKAWEDVHWALLNSKEFLFRH
ncbi:MAG: DUF1553 domain-containing protein [Gemmatales bacterium]|nr:DUF1553 domain-containing protein [Gemmatales bacterium]